MNPIFWVPLLIAIFIFLYRSSNALGGFLQQRWSQNRRPREELAKQNGWEIVTIGFDPFALQGSIDNYFVRLYWDYDFSKLSSRPRTKYEVWVSIPGQIELTFQSTIFTPLFRRVKQKTFQNGSEKAFREQFKISGKSVDIVSDFVKHEDLTRGLLKSSWRTGGVKVEIKSDRIICSESGTIILNKITAEMIFKVLVEIANWVENFPAQDS
jgi:hypothetical protein